MKRIVVVACIVSALLSGFVSAKKEEAVKNVEPQAVDTKKQPARKTKVICSIGLGPTEDVDSFTEVLDTKAECKKYCKGVATVCQETSINTDVNLEQLD